MALTGMSPLFLEGRAGGYLANIRRLPMLEAAEENALAKRFRDDSDEEAADRLITSHLRLVAKIAFGYRGYGLPVSDLISEGNVGLIEAAKRFDPDRGFRFATYATWWIRAEIQGYVLRSWSLVKLGTTAAQRKLFFNLRKLKARLQANDEGDLAPETVQRIATELAVPSAEVVRMNRRLSGPDDSLNVPMRDSGADTQDRLVDESDNQETRFAESEALDQRRALVRQALAQLNAREREIIVARHLCDTPAPLAVIADRYGLSPERIRQIELCAMAKLQRLARQTSSLSAPSPMVRMNAGPVPLALPLH
jgi:RNA polymerase sigma-32 factor